MAATFYRSLALIQATNRRLVLGSSMLALIIIGGELLAYLRPVA